MRYDGGEHLFVTTASMNENSSVPRRDELARSARMGTRRRNLRNSKEGNDKPG